MSNCPRFFDALEPRRLLAATAVPAESAPIFSVNSVRRLFTDVIGGDPTLSRKVRYKNVSGKSVTIDTGGIIISGADASMFKIVNTIPLPKGMKNNTAMNISVVFDAPSGTSAGVKTALLTVQTTAGFSKSVRLRGLATKGIGGSNEPSLQQVMDLYQLRTTVGDSNPNDYLLDLPPKNPNNEVNVQRLQKAASGVVSIEPLAAFIVNTQPALRFGYYSPGEIGTEHELFTLAAEDANSVTPIANGQTFFDPGSSSFGIYSQYPGFKNSDNTIRSSFSEDALNTWDANANNRRKARFYPLKNVDGSLVANAYVVAFEDFDAAVDNQDGVFIIRNVKPATGAEIGVQALDLGAFPNHMAFNRIEHFNSQFNTIDHRSGKLRIFNTGASPLTISSITTTAKFAVSGAPSLPTTIQPSKFIDITVSFTASAAPAVVNGSLTIQSDDADEPTRVISLGGYWVTQPENNLEPPLANIVTEFGIGTTLVGPGQSINNGGKVEAVGEEILSPYWVRAGTGLVAVRQIGSFHSQGNNVVLSWFQKGQSTTKTIFTTDKSTAQTLYPKLSGSSNAAAAGTNITGTFGFRVDNEWSDDKKNGQEHPGGGWGHHLRFFPLRDLSGLLVPDTYLLTMDYQGINYDFNDNTYIISNIRPEGAPAAPAGLNATAVSNGVSLDWEDAYDAVSAYDIFRSTQPTSGFIKVASNLTTTNFLDTGAPAGDTSYYLVVSIDSNGGRSIGANTFATR